MTREEVLGPYAPDTVLTKVHVYSRDLVYIRAIIRPLDERGVDHTLFLRWAAGEWGQFMVPHVSTSFCVIDEPERKVLTLCADGTVHTFAQDGSGVEAIRSAGHHFSPQRVPSEIRQIGGDVYVVGMGREVFRRRAPNAWDWCGQGAADNSNVDPMGGFLDIDGFGPESLYAVGFGGEMWHYDGRRWTQIDSPTNRKLESVLCIPPDLVYATGGGGVVVRGRAGTWRVVNQDSATGTLWTVVNFNGIPYTASRDAIYSIGDDDLKKVDLSALGHEVTAGYLHAKNGTMWSVGDKDVLVADDRGWREVP